MKPCEGQIRGKYKHVSPGCQKEYGLEEGFLGRCQVGLDWEKRAEKRCYLDAEEKTEDVRMNFEDCEICERRSNASMKNLAPELRVWYRLNSPSHGKDPFMPPQMPGWEVVRF